ncbi:MAG: bifunctional precorrin-2 dehydrogenase/sirohydrochlorin ferrochelatase [Terrimonas sp.]|nr:bifunctional precorrin-2 dehydrogenase/sirohydrochlorin ferrochelatase [Terrimonas sp.]
MNSNKNKLYPVFLKLEQLQTLLVGGGNVGLEKLDSLLSNAPEAPVTIVAPFVRKEIRDLVARHPHCKIEERPFVLADLEHKHLVICATDNPGLHREIKEHAGERFLLVNVADTPDLCDLYLGSIVQKGYIKIAISTNGMSPTIAKRIKELLIDILPEEMDELLDNLQIIRNEIKGGFEEKVKRLNAITRELSVTTAKNDSHA